MNKRILFVDDDRLLMPFHALVMAKEAAHCEIVQAVNNAQAWKILAAGKVDIVVADLCRPDMDGVGLMMEIRRRHPRVARIGISRLGDPEKNFGCQNCADPFLANATTKELFAALLRIGRLDAVIPDANREPPVSRPGALATSLQILQELNLEHPSFETIADLALQIPALAAKLVQTANSPAFGRKTKVVDPLAAVQYIGLNFIRSIVMSAHIFGDFEDIDLKKLSARQIWDNARRGAQISQLILRFERLDEPVPQDPAIADLLHHIGKLMLAKNNLPRATMPTASIATQTAPTPAALAMLPEISCATAATNLFGFWESAAPVVEAVTFQLQPHRNGPHDFRFRSFDRLTESGVTRLMSDRNFAGQPSPIAIFAPAFNASDRFDCQRNAVGKVFAPGA